jgi:hypothetical protein
MKCCGVTCETPFCPQCGSEMKTSTIQQIIAFIEVRKRTVATEVETLEGLAKESGIYIKRLERAKNRLAKYNRWIKALEDMSKP